MPSRSTLVAGLAAALALSAQAHAQDARAPQTPATTTTANGSIAPKISGPQPDWVKLCNTDPQTNKYICQTQRDLRADSGQTLASVALREEKGGKRKLIMAIPPGLMIQPGVRVVVDSTPVAAGKYTACLPNYCMVESDFTDGNIASMKKGTALNLQMLTLQAKPLVFTIQLAGFKGVYDGKPMDPKMFVADQKKLQQQLEQKAKDALKSLDGGSTATPASGQ